MGRKSMSGNWDFDDGIPTYENCISALLGMPVVLGTHSRPWTQIIAVVFACGSRGLADTEVVLEVDV